MTLRLVTLILLILYPIAWVAPLMRAGILPIFGLSEISVLTGLRALWDTDIFLALIVALFAIIAPYAKLLALALIQWQRLSPRHLPLLAVLSKLAMADIFLIAVYITLAKGTGLATIETAWGLYLFTACVLTSIILNIVTQQRAALRGPTGTDHQR